MRGKKFGALVLAAALTVASVRCFGLSAEAEEEKASAGTTVSENDPVAVTEEAENGPEDVAAGTENNLMVASNEETTTQLAAPTDLAWGDNYRITFKPCGGYEVEIYKDNELLDSSKTYSSSNDTVTYLAAQRLCNETAAYKFRVRTLAALDDTTHTDSAWVECSEVKNYVRPNEQVGTTVAEWDTEKAGQINYKLIDNADRYYFEIYKDGKRVIYGFSPYTAPGATGEIRSCDLSERITELGEGKYSVKITVTSTNLDEYANGEAGPMSDIYDTSKKASNLSDILADAMKKPTAEEAVETLTTSADVGEIQEAMQTSDSFRGQVKDLEEKYIAEKKITAGTEVSEAAKEFVNAGDVKVVGAAFSATDSSVKLNVDVTPEDKKVSLNSGYLKSVQLDIKLVSGSTEIHTLKVPVSITMPVPAGIDVRQFAILHYHETGAVESVVFHVNNDGTVTFTIKNFSTFVFAEKAAGSESSEQPSGSGRSGGVQNVVKDMIQSAEPMGVITITKEQNINVLSNAEMQMLVKRGDVTLVMEYVYQGKEYRIVIPAGKAEDNDILWYGPLYLAAHYSDYGISGDEAGPVVENEEGEEYIVKKGDTLGAIGRAVGMTPGQIAEKNPQIKNVDFIRVGEKIKLK